MILPDSEKIDLPSLSLVSSDEAELSPTAPGAHPDDKDARSEEFAEVDGTELADFELVDASEDDAAYEMESLYAQISNGKWTPTWRSDAERELFEAWFAATDLQAFRLSCGVLAASLDRVLLDAAYPDHRIETGSDRWRAGTVSGRVESVSGDPYLEVVPRVGSLLRSRAPELGRDEAFRLTSDELGAHLATRTPIDQEVAPLVWRALACAAKDGRYHLFNGLLASDAEGDALTIKSLIRADE